MKIEKLLKVILFAFFTITPTCFLHGFDDDLGDLFGELGMEDMDLETIEETSKARVSEGARSFDGIIFSGGVDEISFWRRGEGARSRDPLFLLPQTMSMLGRKNGLSCNLFFNRASRLPIYPDIVLNMKGLGLLSKLAQTISPGIEKDEESLMGALFKLLPYLRKMTVQEHRIGTLLQAGFSMGRLMFQIDQPLLLSERNFWLCKKDQQVIKDIMAKVDMDAKGNFMKTKFGFGDTRLKFGYKICDSKKFESVVGVQTTLPTSRIVRKKPKMCVTSKVGDKRIKLLQDLLTVGQNILIEPKLGIGHWGLGLFGEFKINFIPDKFDVWGRASYDYFFKGDEYRYMPSDVTLKYADLGMIALSETIPADFPISNVFPHLTKVTVIPGAIFNGALGLNYKINKNWKFGLGYDVYHQESEKIKNVRVDSIDPSLLVTQSAISPSILQHKVFGDITYTRKNWSLGLLGDTTFSSKGAAKDWTVGLKLDINF